MIKLIKTNKPNKNKVYRMKNFSILALVAATMAFSIEAVKLRAMHEGSIAKAEAPDCDFEECGFA